MKKLRLMIRGQDVGFIEKVEVDSGDEMFVIPPIITCVISNPSLVAIIVNKMKGQDEKKGIIDLGYI